MFWERVEVATEERRGNRAPASMLAQILEFFFIELTIWQLHEKDTLGLGELAGQTKTV